MLFDPHVQHLLGGGCSVHGQQHHRGIALFPRSVVVEVKANGRPASIGDPLVDVGTLEVIPDIGVEKAVRAAFRHVRAGGNGGCHTPHATLFWDRGFRPRVVSSFPMANRPTVLTPGPFDEPVMAHLVVLCEPRPVLAWLVSMHVKDVVDFTIAVAAHGKTAAILDCAAVSASACIASVFAFGKGEPPARDFVFPRPLAHYPPGLRPAADFRDWVTKDQPDGNNVLMKLGTKKCEVTSVMEGPLRRFTPNAGSAEEQAVNAFFVCNSMHDFFSLIGFSERDGNFQEKNFDGEGTAGDRLVVSVSTASGANMRAQNDGAPAELTLGLWKQDNQIGNPTALDAGVVIHEFAHGVSQRLVSGRLQKDALSKPQSLALGEAWSDYFAVTILNFYRGTASLARRFTFAEFASKKPGGARPHPYDNFSSSVTRLGTPPFNDQHGAGSIFAAALIRMHESLRAMFADDDVNKAAGQETAWRLVVDSMKRLKVNPTFIDARNALLDSNTRLALPRAADIEREIRAAFAQFGMGRTASCKNTSLTGFSRVDFQS
ncbi:MAG TPA: M36 family metallopeptidase [Thermoanaerobaculia bacterium]|nr:M36 family metallopeptidase [Thermoanaerobaculia bacterium]